MKTAIFIILIASTFSCKKCYECEAIDTVTGQVWDSEYVCGQSEKDNYEATFNDASIDSRADCTPG